MTPRAATGSASTCTGAAAPCTPACGCPVGTTSPTRCWPSPPSWRAAPTSPAPPVAPGVALAAAAGAVAAAPGSPGRMERVEAPGDVVGVVDYAHKPDAM